MLLLTLVFLVVMVLPVVYPELSPEHVKLWPPSTWASGRCSWPSTSPACP